MHVDWKCQSTLICIVGDGEEDGRSGKMFCWHMMSQICKEICLMLKKKEGQNIFAKSTWFAGQRNDDRKRDKCDACEG